MSKEISKKEKELILARLEVLSPDLYFSTGVDDKNYSRDEIIKEIEEETEDGKEFVEIELDFLRAFKDGMLVKEIITA